MVLHNNPGNYPDPMPLQEPTGRGLHNNLGNHPDPMPPLEQTGVVVVKSGGSMTLTEIAEAIDAHLRRFESDPAINKATATSGGMRPFWHSCARRAGAWVAVSYISYQPASNLTRDEAQRYLDKLNAGFAGRHYEALRA